MGPVQHQVGIGSYPCMCLTSIADLPVFDIARIAFSLRVLLLGSTRPVTSLKKRKTHGE